MLIANFFGNPITFHSKTNSIKNFRDWLSSKTSKTKTSKTIFNRNQKVKWKSRICNDRSWPIFDAIWSDQKLRYIYKCNYSKQTCNYNVKQNTIAKIHFDLLEHHTYECICVKDFCDNGSYALGKKGEKYQVDGYCVTKSPDYPGKIDKIKCKMGVYGQAGGWNCVASDLSR